MIPNKIAQKNWRCSLIHTHLSTSAHPVARSRSGHTREALGSVAALLVVGQNLIHLRTNNSNPNNTNVSKRSNQKAYSKTQYLWSTELPPFAPQYIYIYSLTDNIMNMHYAMVRCYAMHDYRINDPDNKLQLSWCIFNRVGSNWARMIIGGFDVKMKVY